MLCHIIESFKTNNTNTTKEIKRPRQDSKFLCSSTQDIFWCGPFLKSLLNLLQYCLCFIFWLFGHKTYGFSGIQPGVETTPPAAEGKVLTTGPPGEWAPPTWSILKNMDLLSALIDSMQITGLASPLCSEPQWLDGQLKNKHTAPVAAITQCPEMSAMSLAELGRKRKFSSLLCFSSFLLVLSLFTSFK